MLTLWTNDVFKRGQNHFFFARSFPVFAADLFSHEADEAGDRLAVAPPDDEVLVPLELPSPPRGDPTTGFTSNCASRALAEEVLAVPPKTPAESDDDDDGFNHG